MKFRFYIYIWGPSVATTTRCLSEVLPLVVVSIVYLEKEYLNYIDRKCRKLKFFVTIERAR